MAEYSKLARGSFTTAASPVAQAVYLPFQPQSIKLLNVTTYITPGPQYALTHAYWDVSMGQGVAAIEYIESASTPFIPAVDYVASSGISTFSAGIALQLGPKLQIASTTKATDTITTASAHGLATGNVVILEGLYQSATTGMAQVSGMPFVITVTSTTAFTINWNLNQSNYTNLSGSPAGAYVQQVLYPDLYLPGVNWVSAITTGTTTTITTTSNHNYVVGQEIAFRIPSVYGTTGLNSLPNTLIPGSPIYGYVTSITSNTVFVCSINSTGFTAFNSNQPISAVPGLQLPQVVAVGDVNTGGTAYSGGALYPSPVFPTFSGGVSTINGPAISGAFVNNTRQGFIVGTGIGVNQAFALLLTASSTYVWEATYFDMSL